MINIEKFARRLIQNGIRIIFISSNMVFDGSIPYTKVDQRINPKTQYGMQKAEAEKKLLALGENVTIVRFTKVISPEMILFKNWIQSLKKNILIHPFSDMVMSPVSVSFAVDLLYRISQAGFTGIFHASGNKDITYEKIGYRIAQQLCVRSSLVKPIESKKTITEQEEIPLNTTLDTSKITQELGIKAPDVWLTIDSVAKQIIKCMS